MLQERKRKKHLDGPLNSRFKFLDHERTPCRSTRSLCNDVYVARAWWNQGTVPENRARSENELQALGAVMQTDFV